MKKTDLVQYLEVFPDDQISFIVVDPQAKEFRPVTDTFVITDVGHAAIVLETGKPVPLDEVEANGWKEWT
jgi:hypothetical protein